MEEMKMKWQLAGSGKKSGEEMKSGAGENSSNGSVASMKYNGNGAAKKLACTAHLTHCYLLTPSACCTHATAHLLPLA